MKMPKTYIQKSRKAFNGKKGQANLNPGFVTRVASHVEKHTSDKGTYFLVLAFIIFLIDLSTTFFGLFPLGPRYAGFEWVWGFDFVNILANIVASGIFGTFALFFIIVKIARRDLQTLGAEAVSFGFFAIVMTFFILNNNWIGTPKAIIHFIFIIVFSFTFIKSNEDAPAFYFFTALLLLIDFFGYTLLSNLVILRYLPFLLIFVIFYIYGKTQNGWSIMFVILLLIVLFIFAYKDVKAQGGDLSFIAKTDAPTLEQTKDDFFKGLQNFYNSWQISLQRQIRYAITGKVEQNQYEPLGVYLEKVKSADTKYYENEDVVIWGTVRARTLDDPINVKIGCYVRDGSNRVQTKDVEPPTAFPVFTLEEQDFACTFKNKDFLNILKSGSNSITAFADFNFETLAFLKVYFMDRERLRAMTRENLDPFDEFGIKDKKPVSKSTNGPTHIGMETTSPLVGVGSSYITFPTLSMSIQSNQGWEGRIKKFSEIILLLPKGVGLTDPQTDCGERKFTAYDSGQCKESSCGKVNKECTDVCDKGYPDSQPNSQFDRDNCKASCNEKLAICQKDCDFLFQEEGQQYLGFALDKSDIDKINTKLAKDDFSGSVQNFEFFRCKLSPKPEEVLENSPITTKSIRAKIRYDYTVEKPVAVRIEKLGIDERTSKIGEVSVTGASETENKVIQLANSLSSNPPLTASIANRETRFDHCTDGTLICGTSNPQNVNCNPSGSCGVMQINKNAHPDLFTLGTTRLNSFGCLTGETAYDIDCNIKSGIGILQSYYNTYGNNKALYESTVDAKCSAANNFELNAKYKAYINPWDRALRAYNGFGCTPPGADVNYVEEVNKIKDARYSGKAVS
ncbi:hypothetical protein HYU09_03550 [Candidatus Woesearchaeota archaeon]|nr:hypothetical protein [Candidatus Woesearchaeota archaeon]